jgi:hypothetical protein
MKRHLVFLCSLWQQGRAWVEPAQIRAFLRDLGGHSDTYAQLIWAIAVISIAVGVWFQDEIRAAMAWVVQGLLGGWR